MPIQQMLLGVGAASSDYETFAIDFDPSPKGASNEIKCASTSDFAFGTGAFTIEFYINIPRMMPTNHVVIFEGRPDGTNGAYVTLYFNGNTQLVHYGGTANSVGEVIGPSSDTEVPYDKWVHVALVRSGTGSNQTKLYINGVSGSNAQGTDTQDYGNQECKFGGAHAFNTPIFKSLVSNYRVTKGQAIYSANFTPSFALLTTTSQSATASNVKLLCAQASNPLAATVTPSTLTQESETVSRPLNRTIGVNLVGPAHSVHFDGNDYLSSSSNAAYQLGTGDFTVEFWWKGSGGSGNYQQVIGTQSVFAAEAGIWRIGTKTNANKVYFSSPNGSGFDEPVWDVNVNDNFWHHIAITRASGYIYCYIDGVQRTNVGESNNITRDLSTNNALYIGYNGRDNTYITGRLSNVRIVKGTAVYTSNFTTPVEPLTDITNTTLLCCDDSSSVTAKKVGPSLTSNGDPSVSTSNPIHKYSVFFDGDDDRLTMSADASFAFGTGDFTIEAFVKRVEDNDAYSRILHFGPYWSSDDAVGLNFDDGDHANKITFATYRNRNQGDVPANGRVLVSSSSVVSDVWYHVAVTRSSGTFRLFIDGALEDTDSSITNRDTESSGTNSLCIGGTIDRMVSEPFDGKISNVRIIKGSALYTSAFDKPTAPLTEVTGTVFLGCNDGASVTSTNQTPSTVVEDGAPMLSEDNPFENLYARV